ncbi:DNA-(apurinic or apyrimidinic site) lyase 2 [Selaginella moellendorffii]|uniref:DNA-(apurinic or apyrimidinic site) lyase 2 n=1 Tax=Selaginella moellendorffii TaxID=88036 RepID=UPI000D1C3DCF|nr:DNA-(apurinic or apyrimidinic site) lyase 2 [Selaginella moellendorffii]|eukprot:XP_002964512.2 DNA-(apurinic or apyrimidinic site) lyase 2 [Selaginella moellendorffii]
MRIVSYNVNGLRARLSPARSLRAFLDSLDADIICLQETKIRRQELTADIATPQGYESFISCTRTVKKGRLGYSGVATFCKVECGNNVALPVAAEEGFTGLLTSARAGEGDKEFWLGSYDPVLTVEGFTRQELLDLDNEGRCIVTDHGHFVLFNIYGPNVGCGDAERQDFKLNFYKVLQCRLESILKQGRRIIIVGDLNISPYPIDSCDPGPEFDTSPSRQWFRSLLVSEGGAFSDAFRVFHPERAEAYTCWSQASGAEEFNYGSRIDHVLIAGPCAGHCQSPDGSHDNSSCDGFAKCGTDMCDILLEFKRAKLDTLPRWSGGRSLKLDGSDHAPVILQLKHLPSIPPHEAPQLAARFMPELRGRQQSILSIFQKLNEKATANTEPDTSRNVSKPAFTQETGSRKLQRLSQSRLTGFCYQRHESSDKMSCTEVAVHGQSSSLTDEIQQSPESCDNNNLSKVAACGESASLMDMSDETPTESSQQSLEKSAAGWERLKSLMSRNLPLCKGHGEPCVVRTVKKAGPNLGRGFYVCARAKGPASNPEARCDHFQWSSSRTRKK